jgi:hypothetical protein
MLTAEKLFWDNVSVNTALSKRRAKLPARPIERVIKIMSPQQVVDLLRDKWDITISRPTLRLWTRKGVLTPPRTGSKGQGGGKGRYTDYDDSVIGEAIAAYIMTSNRVKIDDVARIANIGRSIRNNPTAFSSFLDVPNMFERTQWAVRQWLCKTAKVNAGFNLKIPASIRLNVVENPDGSRVLEENIEPMSEEASKLYEGNDTFAIFLTKNTDNVNQTVVKSI